jgi:hypothetical protein
MLQPPSFLFLSLCLSVCLYDSLSPFPSLSQQILTPSQNLAHIPKPEKTFLQIRNHLSLSLPLPLNQRNLIRNKTKLLHKKTIQEEDLQTKKKPFLYPYSVPLQLSSTTITKLSPRPAPK